MSEAESPAPGGQDAQSGTSPASPEPTPTPPPAAWGAPPPPTAGTEGFVFADVPNRVIAIFIDGVIVGFVNVVVILALGIAGLDLFDLAGSVIGTLIGLVVSIGYFLYSWTRMRATIGMRVLGMQVGNYPDGRTLTQDQAVRRALVLWGPSTAAQFLAQVPGIGGLLGLIAFAWIIYLLYTTATSPTKQGFHDRIANSAVVKASRVI